MNENNELELGINTNVPVAFSEEIVSLIRSDLTPKKLQGRIEDYHEKDIAMAMEDLTEEERKRLCRILTLDTLVSVLEYTEDSAPLFATLSIRRKVDVLSMMEVSAAVELL